MNKTWRTAVTTLAVVAGCGVGHDAAPAPVPDPRPTVTLGAPAVATTAPAPPVLANTGDDFAAIVASLVAFQNHLSMAPRVDLVDAAFEPGSERHAQMVGVVAELVARGYRWDGPQEQMRDVELAAEVDSRSVLLSAVGESPAGARLLDAEGNVVEVFAGLAPMRVLLTLVRGVDERWRISELDVVGPVA